MTVYKKDADFTARIDKMRTLSDNYTAYLITKGLKNNEIIINLTDYGLKTIKWKADDELIKRKVCTKGRVVPIIIRNGFEFEFGFAKNSPDIMKMLLDQFVIYHDGYDLKENSVDLRPKYYNPLSNIRTEAKYRGKVENSDIKHVFQFPEGKIPTTFISPEFSLKIEIRNYGSSNEYYLFSGGKIYNPSQGTSENSSIVDESFEAYFSDVIPYNPSNNGNLSNFTSPDIARMVQESVFASLDISSIREDNITEKSRVSINPNNRNLFK